MSKRITKKEAFEALKKYDIFFGFPVQAKKGDLITIWTDNHHTTKGNCRKLMLAIAKDKTCPFYTFPDIMLNTFRIKRKTDNG